MCFVGFILYEITRLYRVSLREYKTYLLKKNNPNINYIGYSTKISNIANIYIGKNTYINGGELLPARDSKIFIGDNCMISYDVIIRTDMHNHNDLFTPMINQDISVKDIIIGNNVWIGYGAYIMPGVKIGDGVIVAARAVVINDVPDNSVVAGVPAKVVKIRKSN